MSLDIRPARSDDELRKAYALRAKVFVGEQILNRRADDGLLFDVFDALPSSQTFVAVDDDDVLGTVRTTIHDDGPNPSDDFGVPVNAFPDKARLCSGSMLCVDRRHRQGTLGLRLVSTAMAAADRDGATHGLAPVRPKAVPIFKRLGWFKLADTYTHPVEGVPVVPMGADLQVVISKSARSSGGRGRQVSEDSSEGRRRSFISS